MLARPPRKPSIFSRVTAWFRRKLFRQPTFEDIITKFETEAKKPTPDWTAAVARARNRSSKTANPFALPEFPPEAMPSKDSRMAMDDFGGMGWGSQWHLAAFQSIFNEGLAFPGYAHLAQLAQRAENRKFAEILATEMTRKWIRLQSTGDDPKTDKIKKIEDGLDRLRARDVIARCIELDELFGRSHLYIDTGATDDRDELRTSLGNGRDLVSKMKVGKDGIKALRPVEPVWVYPTRYDSNDPLQPNWYEPTTWFVMGKEVHATRLLKFVGRVVPDLLKPAYSFGGLSMSQLATPYVENWLRTRQSVSDLIHAFSVFVLKTDLGASLVEGAELLFKRLELFNLLRDNRGLMMVNKETEDLANVSAPLGGLHELQAQAQEQMASVASIPVVKLLGIQPTGLNASDEGGIRMFYDWILSQQEKRLRPHLTTIVDFIQLSEYGEVDQDINFKFVPLYSLDEKAAAELKKTEADMDATYIDAGVLSPVEVREAVASDPESRYSSIDVEDVPDLREEEEQGLVPEGGGRTTAELAGGEAEEQGEVPPGAVNKGGGGGPGGKPGGGPGGLPKGKLGGPGGGQEEDMDLGGDPDEIQENLTPFEQRVHDRAERHVRGEGAFYDRARGRAERHHKETSSEFAERHARGDYHERLKQREERHARGEGPFYERARARTGEGRLNPDYLKNRRLGHDGPFVVGDEATFKESEHPRDDDGKFAESAGGGGGGSLADKPQKKKDIVRGLLTKGTSMAEITAATGWKTLSLPAMARSLGLELQKYKEDGVTKYKVVPKKRGEPERWANMLDESIKPGDKKPYDGLIKEISKLTREEVDKIAAEFTHRMSWPPVEKPDEYAWKSKQAAIEAIGRHGQKLRAQRAFWDEKEGEARSSSVLEVARNVAKDLGFKNLDKVKVSDEDLKFTLNGRICTYAGSYLPSTGDVTLYTKNLPQGTAFKVTAHEVMHDKWHHASNAYRAELDQISKEPNRTGEHGVDLVMRADGTLKPPYDKKYPAYQAMTEAFMMVPSEVFSATDGVSPYSQEWWIAYHNGQSSLNNAVNETLAEMSKLKYMEGSLPKGDAHRRISYREARALGRLPEGSPERAAAMKRVLEGDFVKPLSNAEERASHDAWKKLFETVERLYAEA